MQIATTDGRVALLVRATATKRGKYNTDGWMDESTDGLAQVHQPDCYAPTVRTASRKTFALS